MPLDLTSPSVPGPFYFAWVDPTETVFDPFVHAREDEQIFTMVFEHNEGDFGTLTIDIRNPRVGLLNANRKQHIWVSFATPGASPGEVQPLFRGRLVGIPNNINAEVVTLVFIARPVDFADQKEVLAYAMQELPFFDRVWISLDNQDNPDTVLEARSELWHIDRVTGLVTTSDLIVGEDGTEIFTAGEVPYDSVEVTLNQTPLRRVTVTANVGWTQADSGVLPVFTNQMYTSFLADSVSKDWPKAGSSLGGGWTVTDSSASSSIDNIPSDAFHTEINAPAAPDAIPPDQVVIEPPSAPPTNTIGRPIPDDWILIPTHYELHGQSGKDESTLQIQEAGVIIPFVSIWVSMQARYDAARNRKEAISFTVQANTQSIITDAEDTDALVLNFSGNDLGKDIGDGTIPIGDLRRRQYFPTARGALSLEYLILIARANLLLRSRAVEITFQCSFQRAIQLSCRKNAQIQDDRLPGGTAIGKIISYGFSANGDTGEVIGTVTIACAIGYGGAVAELPGDPSYVSDGYVDMGYQFYTNQVTVLPAGDIGYSPAGGPALDDGLVFPLTSFPFLSDPHFFAVSLSADQFPTNDTSDSTLTQAASDAISAILATQRCHLDFTARSVTGSVFDVGYAINTTTLEIPKQIDLEAAS